MSLRGIVYPYHLPPFELPSPPNRPVPYLPRRSGVFIAINGTIRGCCLTEANCSQKEDMSLVSRLASFGRGRV